MMGLHACNVEDLERVKLMLEDEFVANPSLYHEVDIERARNDPWQIERYLERADSPEQAFQRIKATFQWKKQVKVHEMRDEDFARELYEINASEILGKTSEGSVVVWATPVFSRDFSNLNDQIKKYTIHSIEKVDQMAGRHGFIGINDFKHMGVLSVDTELSKHNNEIITAHYPGIIKKSIIFNFSWLLEPILKLVLSFANEEIRRTVVVINKSNILSHVDASFVPVEYGGTRTERNLFVPPNAPPFSDLGITLTDKQLKRHQLVYSN